MDRVFCMKECGDNALEVLYEIEEGYKEFYCK